MGTAARGCGVRSPGGIYVECGLSRYGRPIEDFLVDPCREIPDGLDIMPRGVTILERITASKRTGIYDIYDHVGEKHYPNVLDFVVEVRKQGLSRRLQPQAAFSLLSVGSSL